MCVCFLYAFVTGSSGVNDCLSKFRVWGLYFILLTSVTLNEWLELDLFCKWALDMNVCFFMDLFEIDYQELDFSLV